MSLDKWFLESRAKMLLWSSSSLTQLALDNIGNTLLRNVRNCSRVDGASHPRRPESSNTPPWKAQNIAAQTSASPWTSPRRQPSSIALNRATKICLRAQIIRHSWYKGYKTMQPKWQAAGLDFSILLHVFHLTFTMFAYIVLLLFDVHSDQAPRSRRPARTNASDWKFINTHGTSQLQTGCYGLLLYFLIHLWMIVVQSKVIIYV